MILCTIFERIASTVPKNKAINKTTTTTTAVPPNASLREGQVTFLTSAFTSARNSNALAIIILNNYQVSTGQEGFEPPTLGFGIRRSTIRATDLIRNPRRSQVRGGNIPVRSLDTNEQDPVPNRPIFLYLVSLWGVCFLQNLQYFLNSNLCVVVFLFLVPE